MTFTWASRTARGRTAGERGGVCPCGGRSCQRSLWDSSCVFSVQHSTPCGDTIIVITESLEGFSWKVTGPDLGQTDRVLKFMFFASQLPTSVPGRRPSSGSPIITHLSIREHLMTENHGSWRYHAPLFERVGQKCQTYVDLKPTLHIPPVGLSYAFLRHS